MINSVGAQISRHHREILEKRGFTIEAVLGSGGEATVYRANQHQRGACAVKVFHRPVTEAGKLPRQFRDALDFASEFRDSEYIVYLIDWFEEEQLLFSVWQLAKSTLRDVITERNNNGCGGLCRSECRHYLANVAKGLDLIHARSGVHGDIKPANLLIFDDERIRIGDLGTSRITNSLTTRHTDMRSVLYTLPSRHLGAPTRERDLFALAVVYAELRLGRHPYGSIDSDAINNLISNQPQLDGLDDDEIQLLEKVLQHGNAPASAVEWLNDIAPEKATVGHGLTPYQVARSHLTDVATAFESELKKSFKKRHFKSNTGTKDLPPLSKLVRLVSPGALKPATNGRFKTSHFL